MHKKRKRGGFSGEDAKAVRVLEYDANTAGPVCHKSRETEVRDVREQ